MSWIILIVAGCFESAFAFCLGKMKGLSGLEYYLWGAGFLVCLASSMLLLAKAVQTLPIGVDRHRGRRDGGVGHLVPARTGIVSPLVFHRHTDCLHHRAQDGFPLKLSLALRPCEGCAREGIAEKNGFSFRGFAEKRYFCIKIQFKVD